MKARLEKDLGADGAKLKTKSYGSKEYAEESKKSIYENRRVEFEIAKD
jgi:outer membrane protein OmpA-like peptidoglycan-associated protein